MIYVPVPELSVLIGFWCLQCSWLLENIDTFKQHYPKNHNRKQKQESITPRVGSAYLSSKHNYSRVPIQCYFKTTPAQPSLFPANCHQWYSQVIDLSKIRTSSNCPNLPPSVPPIPPPLFLSYPSPKLIPRGCGG